MDLLRRKLGNIVEPFDKALGMLQCDRAWILVGHSTAIKRHPDSVVWFHLSKFELPGCILLVANLAASADENSVAIVALCLGPVIL